MGLWTQPMVCYSNKETLTLYVNQLCFQLLESPQSQTVIISDLLLSHWCYSNSDSWPMLWSSSAAAALWETKGRLRMDIMVEERKYLFPTMSSTRTTQVDDVILMKWTYLKKLYLLNMCTRTMNLSLILSLLTMDVTAQNKNNYSEQWRKDSTLLLMTKVKS